MSRVNCCLSHIPLNLQFLSLNLTADTTNSLSSSLTWVNLVPCIWWTLLNVTCSYLLRTASLISNFKNSFMWYKICQQVNSAKQIIYSIQRCSNTSFRCKGIIARRPNIVLEIWCGSRLLHIKTPIQSH